MLRFLRLWPRPFATFATPFVYPPVGDETFAAYISSEHSRSQRPPVPPPRA